jgi:outer membrane receptor protein involved in Fe transport
MFKAMRQRVQKYLLGFVCFALIGSGTLFAQGTTGTITGVVTDPTGAVIPGAAVTITSQGTGVDFHLTTNGAGIYSMTSLLPGTYTVSVAQKGFKTYVNRNLPLTVNQTIRIDAQLEIGAETQTITVEAQSPLVNTEEGRLSSLVGASQIENMPLNGRNVYQLMQLVPGAVDATGVNGENAGSGGLATNVNGNRLNFNGFLLDGVANRSLTGGSNSQPSPDFVQEFRIMTNDFSAQYGNSAGSVTDVSIKSGTNRIRGDVWEYFRNDKLNARNFFDGAKKQLWRQNQFGFDIGGPIKKDKLFFFGGYEGERFRTEVPAQYTVETAAWRRAVQSALPKSTAALLYKDFPAPEPQVTTTAQDLIDSGYDSWGGNIYTNPCYMSSVVGVGAPSFSGGPNWGDPQAAANNLALVLGVTQAEYDETVADINANCGGMFTAPAVQAGAISRGEGIAGLVTAKYATRTTGVFKNGNQWVSRIDYQGDKARIFGRFFWSRNTEPNYDTDSSAIRGFKVPAQFAYPSGAFGFVYNLSPTIVNEFRFGYTRYRNDIIPEQSQFGVPQIYFDFSGDTQFGAYNGYPQFFTEHIYQYADLVSIVKGKHNVKAGGEVRFNQENSEFNVGRASYSFFDQGYFAADLPYWEATGVNPQLGTGAGSYLDTNIRAWRNHELGFFVQDDWKVTKNLTLNLGLRWDYDSPHTEKYGKVTNFNLPAEGLAAVNCGAVVGGKCVYPPGDTNTPNGGFVQAQRLNAPDKNNFGPRFGFAWDPTGSGKTAIRGGFAITFQTNIFNSLSNSRWNLPFYSFNIACPAPWCGYGALPLYGPTNPDGTRNSTATPTYGGAPDNPGQGPAGLGFAGNLMGWLPTSPNLAYLTGIADPSGLRNPYVESGFLGIQRELTPSTVLEVNWVGTFGKKLFWAENPNRVVNGFARSTLYDSCSGTTITEPSPGEGVGTALLNPCFGTMRTWKNSVTSNYNALQVSFLRKMSGGLAFTSAYTWAHNLDYRSSWHALSGGGSADWVNGYGSSGYSMDPNNLFLEYGNSNFDIRHRWVTSLVWELPWLKGQHGAAGKILGGWQTNYNVALQSGFPFTVGAQSDYNGDGIRSDRPDTPAFGNHYSFKNTDFLAGSGPGGESVFQSLLGQFPHPASGTDGNLGRNTFHGPGMATVDFSLFKKIPMAERYSMEFRAEFFNLFNRVNLYQPIANLTSANFGLSQQAFDPRVIQFGLRFAF